MDQHQRQPSPLSPNCGLPDRRLARPWNGTAPNLQGVILFRSLLLFVLHACGFLHCLFLCVSILTYKRSTSDGVPCKILQVNQDGTMSIDYLRNGKWILHRAAGADNIVDDEHFEVAYEDLPMTSDARTQVGAGGDIPMRLPRLI